MRPGERRLKRQDGIRGGGGGGGVGVHPAEQTKGSGDVRDVLGADGYAVGRVREVVIAVGEGDAALADARDGPVGIFLVGGVADAEEARHAVGVKVRHRRRGRRAVAGGTLRSIKEGR